MPASDSTRIRRDFLSVAGELTFLSPKVLDELALEATKKQTTPGQLALQKGLLDAAQIDIIETLLRPTEVVPGYEILGILGQGGMGVVYRARQLNLKRIVALKTVLMNQMGKVNGAAVSTVLAYSSAAFTAVLGWWFLGESLGPMKILAVTLSLLGCVLVSGAYDLSAWGVNPLGIFTGLASGILFAIYNLMGKTSSERKINPWTVMVYTFGIAALFLFGFTRLSEWLPVGVGSTNLFWLEDELLGWVILITLAVGPTVGGFGLYTVSLGYLPASVANVIATLEPVMTAMLAFVLLGEHFTPPQWAGSLFIIAGVIVLRVSEGRVKILEPA